MKGGKLLGSSLLLLLCTAFARAGDWKVIRQRDRDYVSFANVAKFYQFPDFTRVSRTVSLRRGRRAIRAQAGTSEIHINGVRFFTHLPILSNGEDDLISAMDVSKIIEPILRPSRIPNAHKIETVVLDPGHGGTDQGAACRWGTESAFALDVALAARDELLKSGFRVEMTRPDNSARSLDQRVEFANRFPNALFISIHFNTSRGGAGVETYALAPAGVPSNASSEHHPSAGDQEWYIGNGQDAANMALAASVHASMLARVATFDRGVRHARFHVLRNIKIPAVLIEGGFLSDDREAQRIATTQYRRQMGLALAQAAQSFNAAVTFKSGATFAAAVNKLPPHQRGISEPLRDDVPSSPPHADQPSISISGGE